MPPRQLRLNTLRLSALPFFRSLLDPVLARTITHAYEVVCLENRTP